MRRKMALRRWRARNLREANSRLIAVERSLTSNEGLPNRPWYKHEIYAPGFYTGYGVKTLPGCARASSRSSGSWPMRQIAHVGKITRECGRGDSGRGGGIGAGDEVGVKGTAVATG